MNPILIRYKYIKKCRKLNKYIIPLKKLCKYSTVNDNN